MRKFSSTKLIVAIIAAFLLNTANISPESNQVYAYNSLESQKNTVFEESGLQSSAQTTTLPNTKTENTQYIVSLDGLGDFVSIQEAVNYAKDGDTLILYPGIYNENVEILNKTINIIGVNKNICILQCNTNSYWKVPLTMASGTVSNLTIYGTKSTTNNNIDNDTDNNMIHSALQAEYLSAVETNASTMDSQTLKDIFQYINNFSGYAIHIDYDYLYEKEISFKNCNIISENNYCVGIGSRGNSNITFENCEMISGGNGGCIYLHDCLAPDFAGAVNFSLKNCKLTNYKSPYIIAIQNYASLNPTYLTFENVKASSVVYDLIDSYAPNNINTSFDIDTLSILDKANQLETAGLTSTVMHNMVQELSIKESHQYMKDIDKILGNRNLMLSSDFLPEGITYIKTKKVQDNNFEISTNKNLKKSILNLQNSSGQIGNGWCGLENVYLTPNSCGNTLIEMNSTSFNGLGYYENTIY